jgi:hypothetical protein
MKVSIYNPKYPAVKKTDKFIFKCDYQEFEITADEYFFLDELVQAINRGEVSKESTFRFKRTGETVCLRNFNYLIRKKSLSEKIFGESITL